MNIRRVLAAITVAMITTAGGAACSGDDSTRKDGDQQITALAPPAWAETSRDFQKAGLNGSYNTWTVTYDLDTSPKNAITAYDQQALSAGWTRCPDFERGPEVSVNGCWMKDDYTLRHGAIGLNNDTQALATVELFDRKARR
jgi:phage-related protein